MKKLILNPLLFLFFLPVFSFSQQSLDLASCGIVEYAVNDHSDSDNDGEVCEAKLVLSNSASYFNDEICQLSSIQWTVLVDLDADGIDDLEYSSSLPSTDNTLNDTNGNGIPDQYIPPTTNNEVQNIPIPDIQGASSSHNVTWTVSDDCNLGDVCNTSFTVQDKKAPTPYCISMGALIFNEPFEILAEDFNVGSFDNCTDQNDLIYSFSGDSIVTTRLITCDDVINSPVEMRMYVWDDLGNADYCTVFVSLVPGPNSDCFVSDIISGTVRNWKGEPIEGVEVRLDANALEYPRIDITDAQGRYNFGMNESTLTYSLSAVFDDPYLNGSSTLDLVMIVRHILGLQPFVNPYQIIAADINGNNKVSSQDVLTFRKLILGVISEIPTNDSWRFLRADFEFADPLNPFPSLENAVDDPFTYEFNILGNVEYDFIGVKIGNVN